MIQAPVPEESQNQEFKSPTASHSRDTSDDVAPFLAKCFFGGVLLCGGTAAFMWDPDFFREQYISVPADRERTLLADVQLSADGKSYIITHFDGRTEEISAAGEDCAVTQISPHEAPYMLRFNFQSADLSPRRLFSAPCIKRGFIALGVPQQEYSNDVQEP